MLKGTASQIASDVKCIVRSNWVCGSTVQGSGGYSRKGCLPRSPCMRLVPHSLTRLPPYCWHGFLAQAGETWSSCQGTWWSALWPRWGSLFVTALTGTELELTSASICRRSPLGTMRCPSSLLWQSR